MFDLDGVVYVSGRALPGVADAIQDLRGRGTHVAFVTNNASRTPEQVVARLDKVGVAATAEDVVTAAQAAARLLAETHGVGARVMALGGEGLRAALGAAGLVAVAPDDKDSPLDAIASGYGPDIRWRDIMRAALLIRAGTPYVASNGDMTIATDEGLAPGHGVLVNTLASFAGVEPVVAGKPRRPLMDETVRRVGGERPLMVGDRLDTDIEGANAIGAPALLVLTGVTGLEDLVSAPVEQRPAYISPTTAGLFTAHPVPEVDAEGSHLGGWTARVIDGRLEVTGSGDDADWWRVVATTAWRHLDETGHPVDTGDTVSPERPGVGDRR